MKTLAQEGCNDDVLSSRYRLGEVSYPSIAEEALLWRKYVVWRHLQSIRGSSVVLGGTYGARPVVLHGCNLRCVLLRIVNEINDCEELILMLRRHLELDRVGDIIIEGDEGNANAAIELYRLQQEYKAKHGNSVEQDAVKPCSLKDVLGFILGETLNNMAFGRGNPDLMKLMTTKADDRSGSVEDRLYRLAINRELVPKSILEFVEPGTQLSRLHRSLASMPPDSFAEFVSGHYQPFIVGIKKGAEQALARIVESHVGLVADIARKYWIEGPALARDEVMQEVAFESITAEEDEDRGLRLNDLVRKASGRLMDAEESDHVSLPLDDLMQEGCIGLLDAAERFRPNLGTRYMAYASFWVFNRVYRAIAEQARTVRIPVHMTERISKLLEVGRGLAAEYRREPSAEEIGEEMGLSRENAIEAIIVAQLPLSLDSPVDCHGERRLRDFLEDETLMPILDAACNQSLKEQIDELLCSLNPDQKRVIELRFGLKDGLVRTLEEIGRESGVTRERIRQIEGKALDNLRHPSRSRKLKDYLE